jgi:hypothetical protein
VKILVHHFGTLTVSLKIQTKGRRIRASQAH